MTTVLAVLGLALLIAILVYVDSRRRSKAIERMFAGRRRLTEDEFFQEYFANTDVEREIPIKVRRVLGQELDADLSRLAPGDSLSSNLKCLLAFDSMADVAIIESLEKEFGITFTDEEASAMHTVRDIVLSVTKQLKAQQ